MFEVHHLHVVDEIRVLGLVWVLFLEIAVTCNKEEIGLAFPHSCQAQQHILIDKGVVLATKTCQGFRYTPVGSESRRSQTQRRILSVMAHLRPDDHRMRISLGHLVLMLEFILRCQVLRNWFFIFIIIPEISRPQSMFLSCTSFHKDQEFSLQEKIDIHSCSRVTHELMVDSADCLLLQVHENYFAFFNRAICDSPVIEEGHKVDGIFGSMTEELFSFGINMDNDLSIACTVDSEHHKGAIEGGVDLQDDGLGGFELEVIVFFNLHWEMVLIE